MPPTNTAEPTPKSGEAGNSGSVPSSGHVSAASQGNEIDETKGPYTPLSASSQTLEKNQPTATSEALAARSHVVTRDKGIDCLRGIAVLSVVCLHSAVPIPIFDKAGWMGVDLFFVLSGFLISGLLFREYQKEGQLNVSRFLARRALKIYPSFWLFIGLTWCLSRLNHDTSILPPHAYLRELLFIQNYFPGLWIHTWSLAVEEHFYLFLPLFLLALTRIFGGQRDPFRHLGWCALALGLACLGLRAGLVLLPQNPNFYLAYRATHARMDSLFFGVFLGYLYAFRRDKLSRAFNSTFRRITLAVASVALLLPGYFLLRESRLFSIAGYTMLYIGFGGILLLSLQLRAVPQERGAWRRLFVDALAYVGMYSYSIYLWHFAIQSWPNLLAYRLFEASLAPWAYLAGYFALSLTIGIALSRAVEYPILKLRDRLLPW